jgi:epoxyqueuosine reductase
MKTPNTSDCTAPSHRSIRVKAWAQDEEFDACGIARAGSIDKDNHLGAWLNQGHHGAMEWMARNQDVRQDVAKKLPGVQSVVVVARNYYSPRPAPQKDCGKVSSYAWGRDYHNALKKPLWRLARQIDAFEDDAQSYCCIDTGPVMEKAWAQRAGVGWTGKNSLTLRRDLGSYFFLGVILTTVDLAADAPANDQCGACTLCIDACPTDAIVAPQVLDARRCISYHTIENREDIPEEYHDKFSDWIFGCDICQEVCPWNRRLNDTTLVDFLPRENHANPPLDWLTAMDEKKFRREFEGTPILRAKHAGMMRNAAIVEK